MMDPKTILDAVNEGVYVTDTQRRIVYWGRSAERITGWPAAEVVGKHCHDDVLCHIDKDGHLLCGEEYCPLHRCIVTGQASQVPIIVFARTRSGGRVPLLVAVAPIRDEAGTIVGGVETFRDLSHEFEDISRARGIQRATIKLELPEDPRIQINSHYVPRDILGGDYYAAAQLDANRYGFLLADMTGHGITAALYTMYLNSLWTEHHELLVEPVVFARKLSESLQTLLRGDEPFAAATCGLVDLERGELKMVGAGNPSPLIFRRDGTCDQPIVRGLPFGLFDDAGYVEVTVPIASGDTVLMFTDGATDISSPRGILRVEGLLTILRQLGYPNMQGGLAAIDRELLAASDHIRFDDDVAFLEIRIS